jgi:hypothetical protein
MAPASGQKHKIVMMLFSLVMLACIGIAQTSSDTAVSPARDAAKPAPVTPSQQSLGVIEGPLPDTVRAKSFPYVVVGDIEVPIGKTVTIEQGTVFLFKNLTGLHVLGKLLAQGTKDHPIMFTSENDRTINTATALYPNPYDWNGIYIHADATGTMMNYCNVQYSVYGIVSETKFIRLDPVTFRQNGKSNLVIEGKEQQVGEGPFRYVLTVNDVKAEGVPVKLLTDPNEVKRNIVRYAGFSVLLAGAAGGIYSGMQWKKYQDDLSRISTNDPSVLHSLNESDWFASRDKRDNNRLYTGFSAIAAILGGAGFVWSFAF